VSPAAITSRNKEGESSFIHKIQQPLLVVKKIWKFSTTPRILEDIVSALKNRLKIPSFN
jgi:hypothetical protein